MTPLASISVRLFTDGERVAREVDVDDCTIDPSVMAGVLRELADELDAVAARHEARQAGLVVASGVAEA